MRETTEQEMLMRFMEGLKQAAGSAGQLGHAQHNPGWFKIRDLLEQVRMNGAKMATSRPITHQEAIQMLDRDSIRRRLVS